MNASKSSFVTTGGAIVLMSGFLLTWTPAQAADVAAGWAKAVQCEVCHGMNGMAPLPEAPNLAGQNEIYLAKALHDFKSGDRKNEMMSLMAAALSETDIENLAAYYQSIQITVKEP